MLNTNYKQMIESDFEEWWKSTTCSKQEIQDFLKSQAIKSLNNEIEKIKVEIWKYHELNNEWIEKYKISPELRKELNEMFMKSHNQFLQDHISYLLAQRLKIQNDN